MGVYTFTNLVYFYYKNLSVKVRKETLKNFVYFDLRLRIEIRETNQKGQGQRTGTSSKYRKFRKGFPVTKIPGFGSKN